MEFLYFLESIRNPVLDVIMSIITYLGSEMLFIVLGIAIFWCLDKRQGYFVLITGFLGAYLNQFLKIICRVPRPWVKDPSFTIVESARAEATGYSFPSGHTQSSVGCFSGLAMCRHEKWLRTISIVLCVLVPFSRMYLGVHTPLDVLVAVAMALVLSAGLWFLFKRYDHSLRLMLPLLGVLTVLGMSFILYVHLGSFTDITDAAGLENLASARKNACTLLGALIGLWIVYIVDEKWLHFETQAPLLGQILKLVLGVAVVLLVMNGSKPLFSFILGSYADTVGRVIRYALTVICAGVIWPMTFGFWARMGQKK